jgi:hypothetical protein
MSFAPWIKIETTTPDKPEVIAMAVRLRMKDPDTVTGKLVRLWAWADANSIDGHDLCIPRASIDRLTACKGFAAAMEAVGWLIERDGMLTFPGFDRHNGDSAKRRATEARKKQRQRGGDKAPDAGGKKTGTNVPDPAGQNRGPEEEIESGERERGRDALGNSPAADLGPCWEFLLSLRPEWGASPVPSEAERAEWQRNRAAAEGIAPATWGHMRRFMNHRFGEGDARWQPVKRLAAIRTLGDIAAHATAWGMGAGAKPEVVAKPWPEAFERWAKERFPTTPARALWMSPQMRQQWEEDGRDAA